jgi:hypothetical protein
MGILEYIVRGLDSGVGFGFTTPLGAVVEARFPDAPDATPMVKESIVLLEPLEGVKGTAFVGVNKVVLILTKQTLAPMTLALSLGGVTGITSTNYGFSGDTSGGSILGEVLGGTVVQKDDLLLVTLSDLECRMDFSEGAGAASLSFEAQVSSSDSWHVPANRRPPEFSIGVFDDEEFKRPRPLRFGQPVISTIPVKYRDSDVLSQSESDALESGIAMWRRTMHFRVVCNEEIPSSLQAYLLIALPNGLDTVQPAVSTPLKHNGFSNGQTIYTGSYRFYREDTVNYVDGFAYLSVSLPMTVQSSLPILLSVGGGSIGPSHPAAIFSEPEVEGLAAAPKKTTRKPRKKRAE